MTISDFNLGDFLESLPYEDGPGSQDEYIANALIIKRLQLRNEELKASMAERNRRYIPSSDAKYYIGISRRKNFEYSAKIAKLEAELKVMREMIKAKKSLEEQFGDAEMLEPTVVLSVRAMTPDVLERVNREDANEFPEDDDEL